MAIVSTEAALAVELKRRRKAHRCGHHCELDAVLGVVVERALSAQYTRLTVVVVRKTSDGST